MQQIQGNKGAFAAILSNGKVVTWGDPKRGGDCRSVTADLVGVHCIRASKGAFAAIPGCGSVITWGYARVGGDSSSVQDLLHGVAQISATEGAFAAILANGSVVTWGEERFGGDSSGVQQDLTEVHQIQASKGAFAAIKEDGTVVTWGDPKRGGDDSYVYDQLRDVKQVEASAGAFAAILEWKCCHLGLFRVLEVTVEMCSISCKMCGGSMHQPELSQLFVQMEALLLGAILTWVGIAVSFKSNCAEPALRFDPMSLRWFMDVYGKFMASLRIYKLLKWCSCSQRWSLAQSQKSLTAMLMNSASLWLAARYCLFFHPDPCSARCLGNLSTAFGRNKKSPKGFP